MVLLLAITVVLVVGYMLKVIQLQNCWGRGGARVREGCMSMLTLVQRLELYTAHRMNTF